MDEEVVTLRSFAAVPAPPMLRPVAKARTEARNQFRPHACLPPAEEAKATTSGISGALGWNTRPHSSAGFTFIELLVVLVIVGLIVHLAPPVMQRNMAHAEAKAVARTLVADLRWLREYAIATRRESRLMVDADARKYARTGDRDARALPRDVRFKLSPSSDDRDEILFFPDGTSSGGLIEFVSGPHLYRVEVSWPFGRVSYHER
jgi:general secretion pathway protein H